MENYTLADFIGYFGDWYNLIIPSVILLVVFTALILDWVRTMLIEYVDEGENGPYKLYVVPILNKIAGNMPYERKFDKAFDIGFVRSSFENEYTYEHRYVFKLKGLEIWFKYTHYVSWMKSWVEEYGEDVVYDEFMCKFSEHDDSETYVTLGLYLVCLSLVLTSYMHLPALTVGVLIGYAILRLARTIVRLTKKFNKHISDGHGGDDGK